MQYRPSFSRYRAVLMTALTLVFLGALPSYAQQPPSSQSPFFIIKSESGQIVDQLPLKSTNVSINIAGVIADISIRQEYENTGNSTLEAMYIFPASTKAAVYGMNMTIGNRKISAEVQEKAQARKMYEQATAEGKTAALLEQHRPNVFQMNVGHILPNDKVMVELRYTELLTPENGIYEVMFPTVVGPRYAEDFSQDLLAQSTWVDNPYLKEKELPTYQYNVTANINAGMDIKNLSSPSHKIAVSYQGRSRAAIVLDDKEKEGGTKDYVLRYKLSGPALESGLLTYEGENENFFLAMIQPPERVEISDTPPREFIFILDASGSMRGFPLEITREMLLALIEEMRPKDRFNIMLFESSSVLLSPTSLAPTKANVKLTLELLEKLRGGGGTKLLPALKKALNMPATEGYARSFVIVTDGYISIETEVFDTIRKNLNRANVFAIGAGSSVNRYLIEGIARAGQGEPLVALSPEEAAAQAVKFRQYISKPVLTNIQVDFGEMEVYDVEPLTIPDVLAARPILIFGKYKGGPTGNITLKGQSGTQEFTASLPWEAAQGSNDNLALKYLWARHKIASLADYNQLDASLEIAKEVTALGLKYNLLTNYTSFVAIDALSREASGDSYQVQQALPLPKGVSNTAVNGSNIVQYAPPSQNPSQDQRAITAKRPPSASRTGAATASKQSLRWKMPKKQPVFIGNIALGWADDRGIASTTYLVTIQNFLGEQLWQGRTYERSFNINLEEEVLKEAEGGLLLVNVVAEDRKEAGLRPIALEILKGPEAAEFIGQNTSLLLAEDWPSRLKLASFYESVGMYANAFGILKTLMAQYDEASIVQAHNDFIKRRGW